MRGVAVLVIVALALRLAWALSRPADAAAIAALPDQAEYLQLGRNLLAGNGLRMYDARYNDTLYAFRTVGYPAFIAACGGSVRAVRIVQAALDASTIIAAVLLARRWLDVKRSLCAGALVAANPFLVYFSGLILTETLFTALLMWGMACVASQRRVLWWIGLMLLAASIHVRPGALALPVVLAIGSQFVSRPLSGPIKRQMPAGAATVLLLTLSLAPWAWRNHARTGSWIITTTNSGFTAYDGFNPDADGSSRQQLFRELPELRQMTETQRSDYLSRLATNYARENPRRVMELSIAKIARTWSPVPLSAEYGSDKRYVLAGLLYVVPLFVLAFLGLWLGRFRRAGKVFLLLPAIYLTLAAVLSVGSLRYRVPADVPLAVLAAACKTNFKSRKTNSE